MGIGNNNFKDFKYLWSPRVKSRLATFVVCWFLAFSSNRGIPSKYGVRQRFRKAAWSKLSPPETQNITKPRHRKWRARDQFQPEVVAIPA